MKRPHAPTILDLSKIKVVTRLTLPLNDTNAGPAPKPVIRERIAVLDECEPDCGEDGNHEE